VTKTGNSDRKAEIHRNIEKPHKLAYFDPASWRKAKNQKTKPAKQTSATGWTTIFPDCFSEKKESPDRISS